ncbi:MAG TPA: dihydrolipoamide acetyltransferase family protein, partial [Phototrophicaceae bacterium]|nr:dihydrolipoamide acetyltransferase family protein [Phototrophicaceae bacterium]
MAVEIVMPKLGWTMEEGVLAEWIKHDGDRVEPGEILFTVESDKALQEVEAFDSGILRIPPNSPPAGSTIPVGGLLAYLVQPGEEIADATAEAPQDLSAAAVEQARSVPSVQPRTDGDHPAISPRARRVAAELQIDWTVITGSGRTGRIIERDVRELAETQTEKNKKTGVEVSPVARRMAEAQGVDLAALAQQQPGKRITREDVERASAKKGSSNGETRQPITRMRKLIAERMSQSSQTAAPVTLTTEVDATELVKLRQHLKDAGKLPIPSYNDLFVKLAASALADHPALNARLDGDEIVQASAVHIGLAVDTERGLVVPVIRDAQAKTIRQIAGESARLIEAARAGTLSVDAMSGSTFSITNLGMYEIDAFTPILNLPECAILGIGRIVAKQIVIDAEAERVAIRQMLFLSLTFDHRVVD